MNLYPYDKPKYPSTHIFLPLHVERLSLFLNDTMKFNTINIKYLFLFSKESFIIRDNINSEKLIRSFFQSDYTSLNEYYDSIITYLNSLLFINLKLYIPY
jgi:hypothetical protein